MLDDYESARIDERMRAALGFAKKLTLEPERVGRDDVAALHAAGVSRAGIEDVVYVTVLFNVIDRIADALGFRILDRRGFAEQGRRLYRSGYRLGPLAYPGGRRWRSRSSGPGADTATARP